MTEWIEPLLTLVFCALFLLDRAVLWRRHRREVRDAKGAAYSSGFEQGRCSVPKPETAYQGQALRLVHRRDA